MSEYIKIKSYENVRFLDSVVDIRKRQHFNQGIKRECLPWEMQRLGDEGLIYLGGEASMLVERDYFDALIGYETIASFICCEDISKVCEVPCGMFEMRRP